MEDIDMVDDSDVPSSENAPLPNPDTQETAENSNSDDTEASQENVEEAFYGFPSHSVENFVDSPRFGRYGFWYTDQATNNDRDAREPQFHVLGQADQNNDTADPDADSDEGEGVPFDIQLPYQHLYLARNFQALPGHTYLEEGAIHTLPLIASNVIIGLSVLIPGQTIPLNFTHPAIKTAMRESLDNNKNIFGFLSKKLIQSHPTHSTLSSRNLKKVIGVTLEIFEIGNDEDSSDTGDGEFCCKARVTQRFKLLEITSYSRQWMSGRVLILPEIVLEDPLRSARPASLNPWCRNSNSAPFEMRVAQLTAWPAFVHHQYDVRTVAASTKQYFLKLLTDKNDESNMVDEKKIPDDPVQLSYWILINIPMGDYFRVEMLAINNALQRLQRLIFHFKHYRQAIRCIGCFREIGHMKDVFFMSASGPQGTYVNPSGYFHETITLYCVTDVLFDAVMSTEYSWFPGYAWSVASCARCHCHVGWMFVAVQKSLVPKTFYGLTKRAITLPLDTEESTNEGEETT